MSWLKNICTPYQVPENNSLDLTTYTVLQCAPIVVVGRLCEKQSGRAGGLVEE